MIGFGIFQNTYYQRLIHFAKVVGNIDFGGYKVGFFDICVNGKFEQNLSFRSRVQTVFLSKLSP